MFEYSWGKITRLLLCVLLILININGSYAQKHSVRFNKLGIAEGLPQNTVHCILQDAKGFVWIGTENGLCRYSNDAIKVYKHKIGDTSSIGNNSVLTLCEGKDQNIYIGTETGLNVYNPRTDKFSIVDSATLHRDVTCVFKDSKGNIWVGGPGYLYYLAPGMKQLQDAPFPLKGNFIVRGMAEDSLGRIWLGKGSELVCYDPASAELIPLDAQLTHFENYGNSTIHTIAVKGDEVWFGTQKQGLWVYNFKNGQTRNYRSDDTPNSIATEMLKSICFVNDQVWVGTRKGLYILKDYNVTAHYVYDRFDQHSLPYNSVCSIIQSDDGTVWVGTYWGGVALVYPGNERVSHITPLMSGGIGMNGINTMGVQEDDAGNLWIATASGLNYYDRASNQFKYYHIPAVSGNINKDFIESIQVQPSGDLLVGTLEGLYHFDRGNKTFSEITLKSNPRTGRKYFYAVFDIETSRGGAYWIGTHTALFKLLPDGSIKEFPLYRSEPNSLLGEIHSLHEDAYGTLWIGTNEGLYYVPMGATQIYNYSSATGLSGTFVSAVYTDKNGTLWIGTEGKGLLYFNRNRDTLYSVNNTFNWDEVDTRGIVEDNTGNLWIASQDKISKITRKTQSIPYKKGDLDIATYTGDNWPGKNEYLSVYKDKSGMMLFCGIDGVTVFDPSTIVDNTQPTRVILTDFLIKNLPVTIGDDSPLQQAISYTDELTLQHDQAYFTVKFATLNHANPAAIQYAYMMEGLKSDNMWHYVGKQTSATFTNLDPGVYTFKVKAANKDGLWSQEVRSLEIIVNPPFWRTWYAYFVYVLIAAGLLFWYYHYTYKTAFLKQEIKNQVIIREKEHELVQSKLDFFTNISHDIKTPLTLIMAPVEKLLQSPNSSEQDKRQLQFMQQNTERLMRLMDQLLDFRRLEEGGLPLTVEKGDLSMFCQTTLTAFEGLATKKGIQLQFDSCGKDTETYFDKDKVERMLFNLISNSIKFTPNGGLVKLSVQVGEQGKASIKVEDNGVGIAPGRFEKIFEQFQHFDDHKIQAGGTGIGLAFVKALVERHRGTIHVSSSQAIGQGYGKTCFEIYIPVNREAFKAEEILACHTGYYTQTIAPLAPELAIKVDAGDQKPQLLLVEDDPGLGQYLLELFSDNYSVSLATSGLEGWEQALEKLPDIIISDVMMPGMNGVEFCHRLKNDSRTSHIPIILLSARGTVSFIREGYETGADDYIAKPFNIALLQSRLQNLLLNRKQLRERFGKVITLGSSELEITGPDEIFLQGIVKYIEERIAEPNLQAEELAAKMCMSRMTLYRKLKALTNQSIVEFIRGIRLKRAAQLLSMQQYAVNEVAYMVGFSDVDYFRKWFKKEFGKTPTEFSKKEEVVS